MGLVRPQGVVAVGLKSAIARVRRLRELRGAYRRVFLGQDGKPTEDGRIVLAELRYFCHGDRPTLKTNMSGIDAHASIAAAASTAASSAAAFS